MVNLGTVLGIGVWRGRELGGRVHDELLFHPNLFPLKTIHISLTRQLTVSYQMFVITKSNRL
jgi:hypothetical protein